jgi:HipA-like C-terminal domain
LDFLVAWHGTALGHLNHDGFEWRWRPANRSGPPLIRETAPGKLPPFIEALLPEGWLAQVLHKRDEREVLRSGKRYMSNIAVVKTRADLAALPSDVIQGELGSFSENGRFTGRFEVPAAALIEMPDGMPPALVVERFDIRRGADDHRLLAMENFCSILDLPASAKYDGTIERMARGLRPLSTDPITDLEILFRRALFAWLIDDGDMHLKNLALLKIAEPGSRQFATVRFAPLYDAVTTRVFPGLSADRMALKLNGKDDRLTRQDFMTLARTIELPIARAESALSETAVRLGDAVPGLVLPTLVDRTAAKTTEQAIGRIVMARSETLR